MKEKKNLIILLVIILIIIGGVWMIKTKTANQSNNPAAGNNLPTPIDPKTVGKVVHDRATNKDFISNQIIVEFDPALAESEDLAIITGVGAVMEQRFTAVPLFLIRVEDPGDGSLSREVVKKLLTNTHVKRAELNFLTTSSATTAQ